MKHLATALFFLTAACLPIPVPAPTPTPTATATVTPEPSATPTMLPSPSPAAPDPCAELAIPVVKAEGLALTSGTCRMRPSGRPEVFDFVRDAQHEAERTGFSVNGRILNEAAYTNEVARLIRVAGVCAINGRFGGHTGDDEVWLKKDNKKSWHFDIVAGEEGEKRSWIGYEAECVPAQF